MKIKIAIYFLALIATCQTALADVQQNTKINLPDMGDSAGALITPTQEKELGEAFFRKLNAQLKISQDPEIQQYIQAIGHHLVENSDAPGKPFYFFVVLDNAINAFAGPGGYIGVNSGLILITESESELASVMAHEIAHVTQRHLYRAFEAAKQLSIPRAAAMLAAILLGTQSPEMGLAALTAIQAGSAQFQIDFTRDNEQEADRIGMQTLVQSHYDPRSMPIFFERLQQSSRYYGKGIPEFLRTHPVTASRIADTRGRAEKYPYRQYPDSLPYQLSKAKLKVLTIANEDADVYHYFFVRRLQGTREQRAVARYGLGLIYTRRQQFQKADQIFSQLVNEFPSQAHYLTALARNALEARQYTKALKRYLRARKNFPGNKTVEVEYISTLLKTGQPKIAYRELQSMHFGKLNQPLYYRLLAQIHGALKEYAKSHRFLAEFYYASGNTPAAITQIKLAQKSIDLNFYLAAILDERLQFFNQEEQQRKEDN